MKYLDLVYSQNGLALDINKPDDETKAVFIYFHGGGFMGGKKLPERGLTSYLQPRNVAVIDVDYRVYPEGAKYPDFIVDAADAVAWVLKHRAEYGLENLPVFVGGSSAGGYLSMMLCFAEHYLKERGVSPSDITGFIHDAGQPTAHFNVLKERGLDKRRIIVDESAPLYYMGLQEQLPAPMLFIVSDDDIACRYEQTLLVRATLKHFGYDERLYPMKLMHGKHVQYVKERDENGDNVFGKIIHEFIFDVLNQ